MRHGLSNTRFVIYNTHKLYCQWRTAFVRSILHSEYRDGLYIGTANIGLSRGCRKIRIGSGTSNGQVWRAVPRGVQSQTFSSRSWHTSDIRAVSGTLVLMYGVLIRSPWYSVRITGLCSWSTVGKVGSPIHTHKSSYCMTYCIVVSLRAHGIIVSRIQFVHTAWQLLLNFVNQYFNALC